MRFVGLGLLQIRLCFVFGRPPDLSWLTATTALFICSRHTIPSFMADTEPLSGKLHCIECGASVQAVFEKTAGTVRLTRCVRE